MNQLSKNTNPILLFWQQNNIPLAKNNAVLWLNITELDVYINDMRNSGVTILSKWVEENGNKVKAFYLGCQCAEPRRDVKGCWLHSQELKVK